MAAGSIPRLPLVDVFLLTAPIIKIFPLSFQRFQDPNGGLLAKFVHLVQKVFVLLLFLVLRLNLGERKVHFTFVLLTRGPVLSNGNAPFVLSGFQFSANVDKDVRIN